MNLKAELLAAPAANVAVPPAPEAAVPERESSSSPPHPNIAPPPPKEATHVPPSVNTGKIRAIGEEVEIDVPDGIIVHLTRKCDGNVHEAKIVDVSSGPFEKETYGANPHSGAWNDDPKYAAKNAVDLETDSRFGSAYRKKTEDIPHTRNNWLCYDFKERRIVPTPPGDLLARGKELRENLDLRRKFSNRRPGSRGK
jgi:hypothetical protein